MNPTNPDRPPPHLELAATGLAASAIPLDLGRGLPRPRMRATVAYWLDVTGGSETAQWLIDNTDRAVQRPGRHPG